MSRKNISEDYKARKAAKIRASKERDREWDRTIRKPDYEEEPTDPIEKVNWLKPRKSLGKKLVK